MTDKSNGKLPLIKYELPKACKIRFEVNRVSQVHAVMDIAYFLNDTNFSNRLSIANYLDAMTQDPFFLVASTGLGKTVSVPVHVLLRQCESYFKGKPDGFVAEELPRVWVIEPTIPIAESQSEFMNQLYTDFLRKNEISKSKKFKNYKIQQHFKKRLFGCISSNGVVNPDAPIMFVTTGILALRAKAHELRSGLDRVIIDEAHTTIEKSPDVEIAIGICQSLGVTIDYMSATVDTNGLKDCLGEINIISANEQRFPIWMHNTGEPMMDCIEHLVEETLLKGNTSSEFFPSPGYKHQKEVIAGVLEKGRSHGMLVVVNSFEGEASDINRIAKLLENASYNSGGQIAVLKFASAINRDPRKKQAFLKELEAAEVAKKNYVIISTSVVEMGVTFPTLDYVVTMDSGFDNITIGDRTVPKPVPLGVNALKQRIGRVGRKRAGIGFITREEGANYTELNDAQLNKSLDYEPIVFPLATAPLTSLVYYLAKTWQGWLDPAILAYREISFPSGILKYGPDGEVVRYGDFVNEAKMLKELGIVEFYQDENLPEVQILGLTEIGKTCERWIGMNDIFSAVQLQKFANGWVTSSLSYDNPEFLFWLIMTSVAQDGLADLAIDSASFLQSPAKQLRNEGHELSTLVIIVAILCDTYSTMVAGKLMASELENLFDCLRDECGRMGLDSRKCFSVLKTVVAVFDEFCKNNKDNEYVSAAFGDDRPEWLKLNWQSLLNANVDDVYPVLYAQPARVFISLQETVAFKQTVYNWQEIDGERSGQVDPQNVPVELADNATYQVKIVGNVHREIKDSVEWKPIHWVRV